MTISFLPGSTEPLGCTLTNEGVNFALRSSSAQAVTLCLFSPNNRLSPAYQIPLDPKSNQTQGIWHILVKDLPSHYLYLYKIDPLPDLILDPYAKMVSTTPIWRDTTQPIYRPFGVITTSQFDWGNDTSPKIPLQELIIYEMHVRGFTIDETSQVQHKGTYLGLIEKIPHLLELGINAVELMPIHEFNEQEVELVNPQTLVPLCNYWGYSTVNFFSPMQRYATNQGEHAPIDEFKAMVKALHQHGIEVILDVVYNHTAEGNEQGPILSFKGLDKAAYYLFDQQGYQNYSGCGNTFNCNHPLAQELILNSLRYWVTEMHVDGFRFDLSAIFSRDQKEMVLKSPPILDAIAKDPILAKVKLIAEPWDAVGLYQVGSFCPYGKWSEWNDQYRDRVRNFIKGSGNKNDFSASICGSQNIFPKHSPLRSLNFITSHDGFTLKDLVSYNKKYNLENGEENRDGTSHNISWNCGCEGVTQLVEIENLRQRQMRNFHLALMISQGVPMLLMGDEYGHTKQGNNNSWCQDNRLNWFLWDRLEKEAAFYRYYRNLIHFRKSHPILSQRHFLTEDQIIWHSQKLHEQPWGISDGFLAFTLKDHLNGQDLYVAFNAQAKASIIELPTHPTQVWRWVVNTASPSPYDCRLEHEMMPVVNKPYKMLGYSAILLCKAIT